VGADFLRYPGWLAAEKAAFVIGPSLTGLYWLRRRPESRFGLLLIVWGFIGALYILQSSSDAWLFSIGVFWEKVFGVTTFLMILAFPTGRLDRPSKIVAAYGFVAVLCLAVTIELPTPQVGVGDSISSCKALCPTNELVVTSDPALALDLFHVFSIALLALALATAAIVVRRYVTGTAPQRRTLAIGMPVAMLFLLCEMTFALLAILDAEDTRLYGIVIWLLVAARAAIWCGFLLALIGAELFAARAMQQLLGQSLQHPTKQELEGMLREPLGDPQLELQFLPERAADEQSVEPGSGRAVTVVRHGHSSALAILHDARLNDDPELLNAAGAVAVLAAENAELDAGWKEAMGDLRRSRTRLVRAADQERRKFERNLHDGVQQQLIAIKIGIELVAEKPTVDEPTRDRLGSIVDNVQGALDEVRAVSQGLYPPVLSNMGLVAALQAVQRRTPVPVKLAVAGVDRASPEVESAVYYSCLEAIQNATKHGGPDLTISVTLRQDGDELRFDVADDGVGFEAERVTGTGLQNMQDRVGALGGRVTVRSAPGQGTLISGRVPRAGAAGSP
jgi:signal transduction histidine kinase